MPPEIRSGRMGSGGSRRQAWAASCCVLLVIMTGWADPAAGSGPRRSARERFLITVSHSVHGGIVPSRPAPGARGDEVRFVISPHPGYPLDSLFVDGAPVRPTSAFVLEDVRAPHTIEARFA